MTPAEIVRAITTEGVLLTVSSAGTIKATGDQATVNRWLSVLRENKAEIIRHITSEPEPKPELPSWCRPDCPCLDDLPGFGPGCVVTMGEDESWQEEWRRLDTIATCPKRLH